MSFFYRVLFILLYLCRLQIAQASAVAVLKETSVRPKRVTEKRINNGLKKDRCTLTQQSYFTQEIQKTLIRFQQAVFEEMSKEDPEEASKVSWQLELNHLNKIIGTCENKKMLARFTRYASPDSLLGLVQINPHVASISTFYERFFDASPELLVSFLQSQKIESMLKSL